MMMFHAAAYLINLQNRPDRFRYADAQLSRMGISYERFEAIKPIDKGLYKNAGVRGCAESHYAILKMAAETGNNPTLIIEDDLRPSDDFASAIEAFDMGIRSTFRRYDIIYYYNMDIDRHHQGLYRESSTYCTHFYIAVNPERLLSLRDEQTPIDEIYINATSAGRIKCVSPNRQIVSQNLKCGTDLGSSHEEFSQRSGNFNQIFVDK